MNLRPSQILKIQPGLAAFPVLIIGLISVALSFFWDLGTVSLAVVDTQENGFLKEVGFGTAFNWSIALPILLPAAILYLCKCYRSFSTAIYHLTRQRMILGKDLSAVSPKDMSLDWHRTLDRHRNWLFVLIAIGALFSIWEWYDYSARPLMQSKIELADEWDWSVGALLDPHGEPLATAAPISRLRNALLSLIAFIGQAGIIAVTLLFAYQALATANFIQNMTQQGHESPQQLIPDPSSQDKRRGFEGLSTYLEHSLILVCILYAIFYLSRLQNIYLRSGEGNILEFIEEDLALGLVEKPFDIGVAVEIFRKGMESTSYSADYSSIMVSLAAFVVMSIAVYMIGTTVREAARQSRTNLLHLLKEEPQAIAATFKMSSKELENALHDMVFWPVNYIRASHFFAMAFFGIFCIFFYRTGVILVGLLALRVFWEIAKYIFGKPVASEATVDS